MSTRSEVLLWAQRIIAKKGAPPHELLEIKSEAGLDQAQAAFHKIARVAHPDLHRAALTPDELELVTTAYARVAGAYQDLRTQRMHLGRAQPVKDVASGPAKAPRPEAIKPARAESPSPSSSSSSSSSSHQMSPKALVYYRKAEMALRRGDLRGAVLQLKMAIAADPLSAFLRTALTEVEAEVGKKA